MPENALRQIDPLQPSEETKCTTYNVGDDLYSDTVFSPEQQRRAFRPLAQ